MKRIKRATILLIACFVLIGAMGCSQSIEKRITSAYQQINEADSLEATLALGLTLTVTSEGTKVPIPAQVAVDITVFQDPIEAKYVASASVFGMSQTISEMYVQQLEDGSGLSYVYEPIEGTWTRAIIAKEEMTGYQSNTYLPSQDALALFQSLEVVETDVIDGVKADVVECKLNVDLIWDWIMEEAGMEEDGVVLDEDTKTMLEDIRTVFESISCQVWIAQKTPDILKIKLDLSALTDLINDALPDALMQSLLDEYDMEDIPSDVEVYFSDLYLELKFDNINQAQPFEIPQEALGSGLI